VTRTGISSKLFPTFSLKPDHFSLALASERTGVSSQQHIRFFRPLRSDAPRDPDGNFFSTIESPTGAFSQICPARHCTANLEFRFNPRPGRKKQNQSVGLVLFFW